MNNIIKYKPSYFEGLKKLTKYIIDDKITDDKLSEFINKYNLDNNIIKRILTLIYNNPNIIIYINKYMNNLYDKNPDLIDFIKTFRYILKSNNILNSKYIHYHKSTENKIQIQQQILNLLSEYFPDMNFHELKFFYKLYLINKITNDDIIELDLLLHNNEQTIKISPDNINIKDIKKETDISVQELINNQNKISSFLDKYNNDLKNIKLNQCDKNCKLYLNNFVNIEGSKNILDIGPIDLLIINLFPSFDDYKSKQIFKNDNFIRQQINTFPENKKWLLINLIMCCSKNKISIGNDHDVNNMIYNCSSICSKILNDFPCEKKILIGEDVYKYIINDNNYKENLGNEINNCFIINDFSLSKSQKNKKINEEIWVKINNYLKNIPNNHLNNISDRRYLLDIRELNPEEILIITTDELGNKYYEKKPNKVKGYVRNTDYIDCNIISDDIDIEFPMNKVQKNKLSLLLKEKINKLKEI